MSSLTPIEMNKIEALLDSKGGYVLDFTNQDFERFIKSTVHVNIYSPKYTTYGESKGKRLKAFWEYEGNVTVGKLLEAFVLYYQSQIDLENRNIRKIPDKVVQDCLRLGHRLQGKSSLSTSNDESAFLDKEIDETSLITLVLPAVVIPIFEDRIIEIKKGLKQNMPLSVLFLAGSVLEGLLLNLATSKPASFNKSNSAPKDKNQKVRPFHEWSLNSLIEVSYELGYLGLDVKKHSHSLRDFRNYIHPFEQMSSGFKPDSHTAEIGWKVLKAAMHDLTLKM